MSDNESNWKSAWAALAITSENEAMYHAELGRFITRDPLPQNGEPDLLYDNNEFGRWLDLMQNLYGYCNSRPLDQVDPLGEEPEEADDTCQSKKRECTSMSIPKPTTGCPVGYSERTNTVTESGRIIRSEIVCLKDCDQLAYCPTPAGRCQPTERSFKNGQRTSKYWICFCR